MSHLPLPLKPADVTASLRRVVPELDRLHVLLPEPLELGGHGLIAVPESLPVLLGRLRLGDLDPSRTEQNRTE